MVLMLHSSLRLTVEPVKKCEVKLKKCLSIYFLNAEEVFELVVFMH